MLSKAAGAPKSTPLFLCLLCQLSDTRIDTLGSAHGLVY